MKTPAPCVNENLHSDDFKYRKNAENNLEDAENRNTFG